MAIKNSRYNYQKRVVQLLKKEIRIAIFSFYQLYWIFLSYYISIYNGYYINIYFFGSQVINIYSYYYINICFFGYFISLYNCYYIDTYFNIGIFFFW